MLRTILRPLLVLFFTCSFTFWSFDLAATHLVGGSLNYEYIGQNPDGTYRYRVYSVTYTDVGFLSNFDDPEDEIPVAVYANDLSDPDADKVLVTEFDMPLIAITEVTLAGVPSGCDVGEDIEIERGDYEFFVDLPLNFDGYWLYYDRCCRNDAVVNLEPQQGVGFSTYIPSPLVENSSPFFNIDPVPFLCAGDTSSFLNSAVDPDGDLMVFSFITPFRGNSTAMDPNPGGFGYPDPLAWEVPEVSYNPTFSADEPFGPGGYAFINGATGLTSYMAPNAGQYAVAVEIKEYRNGLLIGIIRRDLQLVVINCPPNPAPDLSNLSAGNVGPTEWQIDEGDTLCFPVIFSDENGDSLTLNSFGEIFDGSLVLPTATINTPVADEGTVQADFCWFTDCDLGRENPYFFGVTASDNGCPPKSASEVYTVEVIPFPGSTMMDGETTPCEGSIETYTTDDLVDGQYTWVVTGGLLLDGQGTNEISVQWPSPGSGQISVTTTNFRGCVGDPFDLDIAVLPLPAIDAGTDVEICLGDSVAIGGAPTGPNGSFFIWGPDQDITDANAANPEVFPTATVDYIVQVISANSCSTQDTVNVIVNSVEAIASEDVDICDGEEAFLNVVTPANEYQWSPGFSLSDDTIVNPIAMPLDTTTYFVVVTDENGCQDTDSVTVNVLEFPVANSGLDDVTCGFEYDLQAIPSIGVGEWISVDPVNFSDVNDPNATATVTSEGVFAMIWRETNNGLCLTEDSLFLEFIDQPIADAGPDDAVCGLEYTLAANPSVGSGNWSVPAGLTINDSNSPSAILTASAYGEYTLQWTETNLTCSDMSSVTITFVEQPIADAGMDDVICGSEYSLSANASVGLGTWSASSVTFSDPNDPSATATSSMFGTQTITWTEDNGFGCTAQASVDITFNEIPVSDAGPDDSVCGLDYSLGAMPSVGNGLWAVPAGLTITDPSDSQSNITADDYGIYTLTWSEDNAGCTDQAQVQITFIENPIADAGLNDSICGNEYTLSATSSVGTGVWTGSSDITFNDITDPNTTITSAAFGTETITWTEDNAGCSDEASVDIIFFEIPEANAGEDLSLCGTAIELAALPSLGEGTWTGPAEVSFVNLNSPNTVSNATGFGQFTLTWTEESNGCIDTDEMIVDYLEIPVASAGDDQDLCIGSLTSLDASGGDSYEWSPGDGLSDINSPNSDASPTDTTIYTVTVSLDNGCSSSDEMTLNVNLLPIVSAGDDVGYLCLGDSIQLNATQGFEAYNWSPTIGLSDPEIPNPFAAPDLSLELDYVVTVTDINDCQNSDTVRVTINPLVPTDAGPDTMICQGEPVILGGTPVSPPGTSYAWSPTTAMNDSTLSNPTVNPIETTTYTVLTNNSICSGTDQVTVIVEETPEIGFTIQADPACTGLKVNFQNMSDDALTYTWDLGDGTTSDEFSPSHQYAFNALYTVTLTGVSDMDCIYSYEEVLDASDFTSYFDIVIPNVFTPNGDGQNDVFDINVTGQVEDCFYMEIFNRWGQTMFNASGNNTRWDGYTLAGELVQPGVYFYVIEFNGASYKGSVQVIR